MDLFLGFGIFLFAIALCMVLGRSLAWALAVGFLCFFLLGLRRGYSGRELFTMARQGAKTSLIVQRIMLMIGLLTALWRASGTISFFVYSGVQLITARSFLLVAFLLPAVLCLAFGSSFGVAGTAGVILMAIARSGEANLILTAGAVLSGCYVGERLSPASSAAALVAAVSGVDQRPFQRRMWHNTPLPLALAVLLYGALSLAFPIHSVETHILTALSQESSLAWPTALPALVLLVLPWLHVSAFWAIVASCGVAALLALFLQGIPLDQLLSICIFGYTAHQPQLVGILSGGRVISMISSVAIILLSCSYSGLFTGTGMLEPYKQKIGALARRIGLFPAQMVLCLTCSALFCNQAVSIVMSAEMLKEQYHSRGLSSLDLAASIGDSAINMAALIPWCIAGTVPLATMGGSLASLPFAFYLYLVPLCHWFTAGRSSGKKAENNL